MTKVLVSIAALMLAGCATTMAPQAEGVRITKEAADVASCDALGDVHSTPPYIWPGDDLKQLRNSAVALKADTVLLTGPRLVVTKGIAYRCQG